MYDNSTCSQMIPPFSAVYYEWLFEYAKTWQIKTSWPKRTFGQQYSMIAGRWRIPGFLIEWPKSRGQCRGQLAPCISWLTPVKAWILTRLCLSASSSFPASQTQPVSSQIVSDAHHGCPVAESRAISLGRIGVWAEKVLVCPVMVQKAGVNIPIIGTRFF